MRFAYTFFDYLPGCQGQSDIECKSVQFSFKVEYQYVACTSRQALVFHV